MGRNLNTLKPKQRLSQKIIRKRELSLSDNILSQDESLIPTDIYINNNNNINKRLKDYKDIMDYNCPED